MRVLLASGAVATAAALAAGGVALAGASTRGGASARRITPAGIVALDASSACSSVSGCVQGCALPVARVERSPASPTSPCSKRTSAGCAEFVTSRPAEPSSGCTGVAFGERLRVPGRPQPFWRLDRRAAERAARKALQGRSSRRRSRR